MLHENLENTQLMNINPSSYLILTQSFFWNHIPWTKEIKISGKLIDEFYLELSEKAIDLAIQANFLEHK